MNPPIALNTGFLLRDKPFLDRIAGAARLRYGAVEFHDEWEGRDLAAIRRALDEAELPLLGLNTRAGETTGRTALDPAAAQGDIRRAVAAARALGGRAVHVLAGRAEGERAWQRYEASLRFAADLAPDLTILVEPLCEEAAPGYLLSSLALARQTLERVARGNVKVMFDVFHTARTEGDLEVAFRANADHIGHVQVCDPETRGPPSHTLLPAIRSWGWDGAIGAEHHGSADLAWLR